MISVIIASRNEPYLQKTILDLLKKSRGEIEIIAVLDGYWEKIESVVNDKRVSYIHLSTPQGMRNAINMAVRVAKGEYLLKCDAHCMFGEGYDTILAHDCGYDWVVVPRRYALDVKNWKIEERNDNKYPISYCYLSKELHAVHWLEKNNDPRLKSVMIDDLMSSQGSCWFMKKSYFNYLELEDIEHWGKFASEFQEIGFKTWLSGGKVKVNKNTWYAHWHKTEGRGYSLDGNEFEIAQKFAERWRNEKVWHKQRKPFMWMVEKFAPVPTW
jgi:glycosyltransferase involved in cell wall biosynthesis